MCRTGRRGREGQATMVELEKRSVGVCSWNTDALQRRYLFPRDNIELLGAFSRALVYLSAPPLTLRR